MRVKITAAVAAIVLAAGGAVLATAAGASAATASYTVGAQNISMGGSFAGLCLDDYKQNRTSGAKVVLWTCSKSDSAQQWFMASNGSIRLGSPTTGPALDVVNGKVVLGNPEDANAKWFPLGDWGLVNMGLSSAASGNNGPSLKVLNDPGYSKTLGTQLITFARSVTANAQFNIPGTTYKATALSNRPDGSHGPVGNFWAADTMTRHASVTALGGGNYEGNVVDNGSFLTYVGNSVPNQGQDPGKTIGDSMTGSLAGTYGFTFTANQSPSSSPPGSARGVEPTGTSNWYKLFFPSTTTFGGSGGMNDGPMGYSWQYSGKDNCGTPENYVSAATNGDGNTAGDGDITAPAAASCS